MSGPGTSAFWLLATLAVYAGAKLLQRRLGHWWVGPAVVAPPVLVAATLATGTDYATYLGYSSVLIVMLGPVTVAFACPVWDYRATIRAHWPVLLACLVAGALVSLATGYALARLLDFPELLTLSLLPRSMTSPFAMPFAASIGGDAKLAAMIVIVVGIIGGLLAQFMLRLPVVHPLAKGLMLGISAHGVGTAFARELGREESAVAALAMILMGLLNIIALTLLLLFSA